MTYRDETIALQQAVAQTMVLLEAEYDSIAEQVDLLSPTNDLAFNSNLYIAMELTERIKRAYMHALASNRVLVTRLASLGIDPIPPLPVALTPYGIVERITGFSSYRDATPQLLVANAVTAVLNNRSVIDEAQKPPDVLTFYDGTHFRVGLADAVLIRATFNLTATDGLNIASLVKVWLDIGSGTRLFEQTIPLAQGLNAPEPIAYLVPVFAGPTFVANGAVLRAQVDGAATIDSVSYFVSRLHKKL